MVKQLDQQMIRNPSESDVEIQDEIQIPVPSCLLEEEDSKSDGVDKFTGDAVPSLASICLAVVSANLSLEKCLETLLVADRWQNEELKINCLKFISLNIVSFLEPYLFERLQKIPVYLIRDIQNFIKTSQVEKYSCFSMAVIEQNYYN